MAEDEKKAVSLDDLEKDVFEEEATQLESIEEILLNTREQGQMMNEQMQIMKALIEKQIDVKDDTINRLHDELEFYKQDAQEKFANQLIKGIIKIRSDMKKKIDSEKWNEISLEALKNEYAYIFEDITDFLEQLNVDAFSTDEGAGFDRSRHQVAKTILTEDASLDKKVAASKSEGYVRGDKLLIAERVDIYQLKSE